MLKKDGFSAQVIARGEATEKKQKKLLDKAYAVSPEDEEQLLAEQVERSTTKNRRAKADAEDQVAYLVFKKERVERTRLTTRQRTSPRLCTEVVVQVQ
jgi:hypothetical protein